MSFNEQKTVMMMELYQDFLLTKFIVFVSLNLSLPKMYSAFSLISQTVLYCFTFYFSVITGQVTGINVAVSLVSRFCQI